MMIAMRGRHQVEGFSAVRGAERTGVEHVHDVGRDGVGKYMAVVPGALPETMILVDPSPGIAGIIRAEQAAFGRFDHGVHAP